MPWDWVVALSRWWMLIKMRQEQRSRPLGAPTTQREKMSKGDKLERKGAGRDRASKRCLMVEGGRRQGRGATRGHSRESYVFNTKERDLVGGKTNYGFQVQWSFLPCPHGLQTQSENPIWPACSGLNFPRIQGVFTRHHGPDGDHSKDPKVILVINM